MKQFLGAGVRLLVAALWGGVARADAATRGVAGRLWGVFAVGPAGLQGTSVGCYKFNVRAQMLGKQAV